MATTMLEATAATPALATAGKPTPARERVQAAWAPAGAAALLQEPAQVRAQVRLKTIPARPGRRLPPAPRRRLGTALSEPAQQVPQPHAAAKVSRPKERRRQAPASTPQAWAKPPPLSGNHPTQPKLPLRRRRPRPKSRLYQPVSLLSPTRSTAAPGRGNPPARSWRRVCH